MRGKKFCRFEKTFPLLRGYVQHSGAGAADPIFQWLKLSHALDAVRSPGPAQEFDNQSPSLQEGLQTNLSCAVRRLQRKPRRGRANLQRLGSILHLCRL